MNEVKKIRLKKEERIHIILKFALEIFARDGYKQASTKEIAQLSDCTEALIFKYFKTKDDLFNAIIKEVVETNDKKYVEVFNLKIDLNSFFKKLIRWQIRVTIENLNLYKVFIRHEFSSLEFARQLSEIQVKNRLEPLVFELKRRQELGEIDLSVDCKTLGYLIMEILNSLKYKLVFLEIKTSEIEKIYGDVLDLMTNKLLSSNIIFQYKRS